MMILMTETFSGSGDLYAVPNRESDDQTIADWISRKSNDLNHLITWTSGVILRDTRFQRSSDTIPEGLSKIREEGGWRLSIMRDGRKTEEISHNDATGEITLELYFPPRDFDAEDQAIEDREFTPFRSANIDLKIIANPDGTLQSARHSKTKDGLWTNWRSRNDLSKEEIIDGAAQVFVAFDTALGQLRLSEQVQDWMDGGPEREF